MRILLFTLLLPVFAFSQQTNTYLKINDPAGAMIKGTSVAVGFENAVVVSTINSDATQKNGGKLSNTITFSMPVSGASGEFRRVIGINKPLPSGEITSLQNGPANQLIYKLKMENITVISINDALGCNGTMTTTVVLSAERMGWTYFASGRNGQNTVASKYGWDAGKNREWTGF